METQSSSQTIEEAIKKYAAPLSVVVGALFIAFALSADPPARAPEAGARSALEEAVLPAGGVELPVIWGDLGAKLVESGAIDAAKLKTLYESRGGFSPDYANMLTKGQNQRIVINSWNAGYLLNLFWALGLANTNSILEDRNEMMNPAYGGAGRFASTGGWTLAMGDAMEHYGKHPLVQLTKEQQSLVDRVSRGIYRPCCDNSTHFPDCNHGMAMLGLLELMAAQGVGEEEMYRTALAVNAYWFPETYLTIAAYEAERGIAWRDVSPRKALGDTYSSATGYQNISARVKKLPERQGGAGGCST